MCVCPEVLGYLGQGDPLIRFWYMRGNLFAGVSDYGREKKRSFPGAKVVQLADG